ncbi:MAG: chemotaxis family two-component system response regulator Rcp1 [Verrucomicrobiales bacterium]|jgi:chemotaxis family two-component system response regulator Rcp1
MTDIVKILLVEDNDADADLTMDKLATSKIPNEVRLVRNGVDATTFLRTERFRPEMVLLDLNLPGKNGREVLAEMKADASLRRIPVVILTSSQTERDIRASYELQASAYITKPVNLAGFGLIVEAIESFWLTVVKFPHAG